MSRSGSDYDIQVRPDGTACIKYEPFTGKGTGTLPNGDKYVGEWKDGKVSGEGTLTFPNKASYKGHLLDGTFHGKGTLILPNGHDAYVGEFENGSLHGYVKFTSP